MLIERAWSADIERGKVADPDHPVGVPGIDIHPAAAPDSIRVEECAEHAHSPAGVE